jgi:hypothetical protein
MLSSVPHPWPLRNWKLLQVAPINDSTEMGCQRYSARIAERVRIRAFRCIRAGNMPVKQTVSDPGPQGHSVSVREPVWGTMFACERCNGTFSPRHGATLGSCPDCLAKDGVEATLYLRLFERPPEIPEAGQDPAPLGNEGLEPEPTRE